MRVNYYKHYNIVGWLFVIPFAVAFSIFTIYPIISSLLLTFQDVRGLNAKWVGITNYQKLLTDELFLKSLQNTLMFLVIQVPIMLVLGLIIAVTLTNPRIRGKGFFRTMVFLPCITSLVSYSMLFKIMFSVDGVINQFLASIFPFPGHIDWLNTSFWARALIVIAITWRWTGYNSMFYISALQNIPGDLFEAADIDGAGPVKKFMKIIVPLLKPNIIFTSVCSTIGTLQLFDEPFNITAGGPTYATMSISQYIFNLSFRGPAKFSYAATVSYVIVLLTVLFAIIQFKGAGDNHAD